MIAKVSTGGSFGGVVRYLFEGHYNDLQANKQAEILAANGVRLGSMEQMISDFNRHRTLNVDLGVAVWHTALSFHADDREKLSDQLLIRLAEEYISELQLEPDNVQWLLVKHNDTAHPHVHLLMNRVDFEGRTIDRSFYKVRSRQAALRIARRHELTVSTDLQQQKRQYGKPVTTEQDQFQQKIRQIIEQEVPQVATLIELAERLKPKHIAVHFQYRKKRKGERRGKNRPITGIVFETEGKFVRGSTLGEGFSAGALTKRIQLTHNQKQAAGNDVKVLAIDDGKPLVGVQPRVDKAKHIGQRISTTKKEQAGSSPELPAKKLHSEVRRPGKIRR